MNTTHAPFRTWLSVSAKGRKSSRLHDGASVGGNARPQVGALLANGARDGGTLHLALGVDDDTSVVCARQQSTNTACEPRAASAYTSPQQRRPKATHASRAATMPQATTTELTLEVEENAVLPAPRLALANHHGGGHCKKEPTVVVRFRYHSHNKNSAHTHPSCAARACPSSRWP